jgi:hypothetical protein
LGAGDATGNCQLNELRAYTGLLVGGCSTAARCGRARAAPWYPVHVLAIDWPPVL